MKFFFRKKCRLNMFNKSAFDQDILKKEYMYLNYFGAHSHYVYLAYFGAIRNKNT